MDGNNSTCTVCRASSFCICISPPRKEKTFHLLHSGLGPQSRGDINALYARKISATCMFCSFPSNLGDKFTCKWNFCGIILWACLFSFFKTWTLIFLQVFKKGQMASVFILINYALWGRATYFLIIDNISTVGAEIAPCKRWAFWLDFCLLGHVHCPECLDMAHTLWKRILEPYDAMFLKATVSWGQFRPTLPKCIRIPKITHLYAHRLLHQTLIEGLERDWPHVEWWGHKGGEGVVSVITDNIGHGRSHPAKSWPVWRALRRSPWGP